MRTQLRMSSKMSILHFVYTFLGLLLGVACSFAFVANIRKMPIPLEYGVVVMVLLPFVGVIIGHVIASAQIASTARELQTPPLSETQAYTPRSFSPQIVGKVCVSCDCHLMVESDGSYCKACRQIYCVKCEPESPCSKCQPEQGNTV